MNKKFAIILGRHRKFGIIASAYTIVKHGNHIYYTVFEKLTELNVLDASLSDWELELIRLCDSIADDALFNRFGKRHKSYTDFFQKVKPELTELHIIPFIERKLSAILKIVIDQNVSLYFMERRPKNLYPEDELKYSSRPARTVFNFSLTETDFRYFLSIDENGQDISLSDKAGMVIINDPCYLVLEERLLYFKDIDGKKLLPFFSKEYVSIPKSAERKYLSTFVKNSISQFKVRSSGFTIQTEMPTPKVHLLLEEDLNQDPVFIVRFIYDDEFSVAYGDNTQMGVTLDKVDGRYVFRKLKRNQDFEQTIISELAAKNVVQERGNFFRLEDNSGSVEQVINWLDKQQKWLANEQIQFKQNLNGKQYLLEKPDIKFEVKSKIDWFDIYGKVTVGNFEFSFFKLKNYIMSGKREFPLPDGTIAILPDEWFTLYEGIFQWGKEKNGQISLHNQHFNLLRKAYPEKKAEYIEQLSSLSQMLEKPEVELPEKLNAKLRGYQREGYSWMNYLKQHNFGGCLADDMGLGKTLQTLSLLLNVSGDGKQMLNKFEPNSSEHAVQLDLFGQPIEKPTLDDASELVPASLIVMPTSLIHNWKNEIAKFTPDLKVYTYHGSNRYKTREPQRLFNQFHVILTSYGTLRIDIDYLKNYQFNYVVLDESQFIKNPTSKAYKAVLQVNARYRLALTGTPIENSLKDLWTQMNFLNPGLLGGIEFFTKKFQVPIEKGDNEEQREMLKTVIQPFLLRRTKNEVAKDLPDLTIQTIYCELTDEQREEYRLEKNMVRKQVLNSIETDGIGNSSMFILQGLQKLRQLAIHPSMVVEDYAGKSGKFEEAIRMIESLKTEGHKVLLFSSFVKQLNLFSDYFVKKGWRFSMLTGQTKHRERVINDFQNSDDNQLFLISIKAGGVGLNLTSADYIFVLDPWWNPAVELQAINRAHRIGQDKHVFVYRFISESTIEEKIHRLQEAKSALADQFVNTNNPFAGMDIESIKSFLT